MKLIRKVALDLGMVFTRFTNTFAFCPEFGGGDVHGIMLSYDQGEMSRGFVGRPLFLQFRRLG
jgi:hypothetical protein